MSISLLEKICTEMDLHPSINTIYLFNKGEPLAHPKLRECLEIIYSSKVARNASVIMHTNASLLKGEIAAALLEVPSVTKLVFSFDGYGDKESFELMRGKHYNEVLSNISKFAPSALKTRPDLDMATCTILPGENDIPGLKVIPRETAVSNLKKIFEPLGIKVEVRSLSRMNSVVSNAPNLHGRAFGGCIHVERDSLYISATGNAMPCCNVYDDNFNIGSVLDTGFVDLLNGEKMAELRHFLRLDKREHLKYCCQCTNSIGCFSTIKELRQFWMARYDQGLINNSMEQKYIITSVIGDKLPFFEIRHRLGKKMYSYPKVLQELDDA